MKLRSIILYMLFVLVLIITVTGGFFNFDELKIISCVVIMFILFLEGTRQISNSNREFQVPILSDGRFYFLTFITLYSMWVPILAVFADITNVPFASLNIYGAITYGVPELLKTCFTSIVMLLGICLGIFLINHIKFNNRVSIVSSKNRKTYKVWFWIALISTIIFLLPFIMGGFKAIRSGGSILDVEQVANIFSGNIILTLIGFLFNSEVMTISTSAYLMYYVESEVSTRKKGIVIVSVIFIHALLAIATTRSARFIIILVCVFACTIKNKEIRQNKVFKRILKIIPLFIVMVYFIDYIIVNEVRSNFLNNKETIIVEIMRRFDGVGPYDALFRAVDTVPDIKMLENVVFSFFRGIPVVGKNVINILGMNASNSPLYNWMASQYNEIYSIGGGLAYMPQIEAYLTLGYAGCFIYGLAYGLIFGKRRSEIGNLIIIAMGLMLARGSFGVIASLSIQYVGVCYILYDKFLLRTILKRKSINEG